MKKIVARSILVIFGLLMLFGIAHSLYEAYTENPAQTALLLITGGAILLFVWALCNAD